MSSLKDALFDQFTTSFVEDWIKDKTKKTILTAIESTAPTIEDEKAKNKKNKSPNTDIPRYKLTFVRGVS